MLSILVIPLFLPSCRFLCCLCSIVSAPRVVQPGLALFFLRFAQPSRPCTSPKACATCHTIQASLLPFTKSSLFILPSSSKPSRLVTKYFFASSHYRLDPQPLLHACAAFPAPPCTPLSAIVWPPRLLHVVVEPGSSWSVYASHCFYH